MPELYIITPCSRPDNLGRVLASLRMDAVTQWIIVHDSDELTPRLCFDAENKVVEVAVRVPGSVSGNGQRNAGLDLVPAHAQGFVYFLDDDNEVHPGLWDALRLDCTDTTKFYTWDQQRGPHTVLPGNNIPTAMVAHLRWPRDKYEADGHFIAAIAGRFGLHAHVYNSISRCAV